jgi:hypothetical protein
MPLTAGKRDEENERFKNTLQRLVSLTLVPEHFGLIDTELDVFGLSLEALKSIDSTALIIHLQQQQLNFENAEQFADFLAAGFPTLAKAVYEYVQGNSGAFSFGIFNKINALKL